MSSCQNISHVGISSLTSGAGEHLQELTLSYVSPVSLLSIKFLCFLIIIECITKL